MYKLLIFPKVHNKLQKCYVLHFLPLAVPKPNRDFKTKAVSHSILLGFLHELFGEFCDHRNELTVCVWVLDLPPSSWSVETSKRCLGGTSYTYYNSKANSQWGTTTFPTLWNNQSWMQQSTKLWNNQSLLYYLSPHNTGTVIYHT